METKRFWWDGVNVKLNLKVKVKVNLKVNVKVIFSTLTSYH